MTEFLLNKFIVENHVKQALMEDIGYGDISTDFLSNDKTFRVFLVARQKGIFCGKMPFELVFKILADDEVKIEFYKNDGDKIEKGDKIAKIEGCARYILTGERLSLNYVQKMSAISTKTAKYVDILKPYNVKIADTRKNTPNFRMFEKYAIKVGKGSLHRFNLCDCVMLKDNHIALMDGSIELAYNKIKENLSHAHKIEIECDNFEQVKLCAKLGVDIIMLDNMANDEMVKCVDYIRKIAPNTIIEASGGVSLETVENIAKTGVDVISTSDLINAHTLDFGFDYLL